MDDYVMAGPPSGAGSNAHLYALLVQSIEDSAICLIDTDRKVVTWNRGAELITGYPAGEIQGQPFAKLFTDIDQRDRVPCKALADARNHGQYEGEGWLRRKDGSQFWASIVITPARDDSGELAGYACVTRNISEKRQTEHALFNSEQRFRMLVEGVRDYAIYMLDPQGYITNWNSGAALIKGYTADEVIGQHFSLFYTEEDRQRGEPQRGLNEALRANSFQNEGWRVRKDGSHFWASIVIDPIYDEDGKLAGFAKVTRDVTERKLSEEKRMRQREAMHQSQKLEALGRLTGSVAHDFNNMLSVIRTAAELLDSGDNLTPEKVRRYLGMILDTGQRAARLTNQLLTFARQQPLQLEVFSPKTRIEGLSQVIETSVGSRVQLIIDLPEDLANVESDVTQFDTALLNLVINARDAMPEGGTVTITGFNADRVSDDGGDQRDYVAIEVSDTGAGIDPETLPHIFEPFFTTKAVNKGTGLGLSQVYGYVKQTGGDIRVQSALEKGTRFTLYLPRVESKDVDNSWDGLLTASARQELPATLLAGNKGTRP